MTVPPTDPTYAKAEIDADPAWRLAWRLSEVDNDDAPIGWSRYIPLARWVLNHYEEKRPIRGLW